MDEGILHDGLEGEGWDADLHGVHLDLLFVGDAPVKAGLLDIDVVIQGLQLLLKEDLLLLGPQIIAENAA